ncbi:MAG: ATP-binding protein [Solobacterium sp.]|nr:ATP-binding protein [Solobacterium sp.]
MILMINKLQKSNPSGMSDVLLMLPNGYGVSKEDELTASPRSLQQVITFSKDAYDFCLKHGAGKKEAYYISLAAEEMASNIFKHGFTDRGHHTMELRVIHTNNALCLRIRDNSHIFDPIKKMAAVAGIDDPSRYIGIRMVMKLADEITYTPTLN